MDMEHGDMKYSIYMDMQHGDECAARTRTTRMDTDMQHGCEYVARTWTCSTTIDKYIAMLGLIKYGAIHVWTVVVPVSSILTIFSWFCSFVKAKRCHNGNVQQI
jgi:hypothetical protein